MVLVDVVMPKIEQIDITGGHVTHQTIRRWRNRVSERKRPRQVKFHVAMLREKAHLVLPAGTRFHIALRGDIEVAGGVMAACYQSTAEMMFDAGWPAPVEGETPTAEGWLIIFRGVAGNE